MMKRGSALLIAALMFLLTAIPALGADVPYPDVSPDHWAYEAIERLHNAGLIEGYPDGTFGGERTFTRYEMAMVFDRILGRYDAHLESVLADLGVDLDALTDEFGPELGLISALAAAISDAQRDALEAKAIAEAAAGTAETASDRAYHARLTAEQALADAKKANETASMALALAGGEGADGTSLEEVRLAAQRAQRLAANAESAAMRANAVAEMAFAATQDSLEDTVEATRLAAQRAQRLAADAEAAALKAQAMAERAGTTGEAEAALGEVEDAADRAYRARLTAEQALALGEQADEKATRALSMSEIAMKDVASVSDVAQDALETARQADRLAYLAHLSAERALDSAEGAHDRIDDLENRVAATPKITASLDADYELAHTNDPGRLIDPRGAANGPKTENKSEMNVAVALGAAVEPREGVRAEGGIKFNRNVFGGSVTDVGLSDLYAQVTTDGVLRKAYFGAVTGANLAEGFNKFALDARRYGANVDAADRGGASVELQTDRVNTRVIGSLTGPANTDPIFYGIASNIALEQGLNLGVSYAAQHEAEGHLGLNVAGELEALSYDVAFGRFKDEMSIDATAGAQLGEVTVDFAHRTIGDAFDGADPEYFGKVYTDKDDGITPGRKDTIFNVGAPLFGLDLGYEKGYKATLLDTDYTNWHKVGFSDADILGFGLSAHFYTDEQEVTGTVGNTQAYRIGLDRTVNLGVPVKFSVVHADIAVEDLAPWTERTHQAFGVAIEDLALSEGLTVGAGYKLERNPLDGDWTDYGKWIVTEKDDNDDPFVIDERDRSTFHVNAELAAGPLTFSGGYELVNQDTDQGEVDFKTVDLGADYSFGFLDGDATLGYAWQSHKKDGSGFSFDDSPRSTYSVEYERAAWGGTVDLGYKYVTGRGDDGVNKKDSKDTMAHLDYTYPVADGMDFTLGGKWTSTDGDTDGDYYYSSVKAGFAIKF